MASYAERYVAFLDILGFRDLISRSVGQGSNVTVDQICSVLDIPDPAGEEQIILGRIGDISKSGHRLTAFSDSIVITTDATEQGLIHLLHHVAKIGFRLARLRTLYRGGIERGLTYHDKQQVFGPAVIAAYDLERQARMPRVLLGESVIKAGREAAEPISTIFGRFIYADADSEVFVDYFRVLRMIGDTGSPLPKDMLALHGEIESFIASELKRCIDRPSEKIKVEWFKSYFHRAIYGP